MRFFTTERLGAKREITPEGFLLCRRTPIGRIGMQMYHPSEITGDDGKPMIAPVDGVVRVDRIPEEVFDPISMSSGRGKPIVDDHPDEDGNLIDVTSENWRELAVGTVMDIYPGDGVDDDVLLGDLLITDAAAIKMVNGGKRQLSIGYTSDYYETGPGRAEQRNIRINHVALVDQGRCGPRCAIGDKAPGGMKMADKGWLTKLLLRAHVARDAAEVAELAKEAPGGEEDDRGATHIHVHAGEKPAAKEEKAADEGEMGAAPALQAQCEELALRVGELEDVMVELAGAAGGSAGDSKPDDDDEKKPTKDSKPKNLRDRIRDARRGTRDEEDDPAETKQEEIEGEMPADATDKARKARDSVYLKDSFDDTIALAEIVSPGIKLPVFNLAAAPVKTFDAICGLRKAAVTAAYATASGKEAVDAFMGARHTFDAATLRCETAKALFQHLGAVSKARNADNGVKPREHLRLADARVVSGADLNKLYAEHYAKQKG